MVIRYVISHINRDGMRKMTYSIQGLNTRGSKEEAQKDLQNLLANNTKDNLIQIFGEQSIGTFEVSAIECYDGHFDPKGCWIRESINPGQVCLVGEIKKLMEELEEIEGIDPNPDILKIGDKVLWRGSWGANDPKLVTVTGISIGTKEEDNPVESVKWSKIGAGVVVDLDNHHWAYGYQISKQQ